MVLMKRSISLLLAIAIVFTTVGAFASETETTYTTLKSGSKGDAVVQLQTRLTELAYDCGVIDGSYGKNTASAVKEFQGDADLKATGQADARTQALLHSDEAWDIRAAAIMAMSIDLKAFEKSAKSVVKSWNNKSGKGYGTSASYEIESDSATLNVSMTTTSFETHQAMISIYRPNDLTKVSISLSICIPTLYISQPENKTVYLKTKNFNQKIDDVSYSTPQMFAWFDISAYPEVAAELAKSGGTVYIGSTEISMATNTTFYKIYKSVYQTWMVINGDRILKYQDFLERFNDFKAQSAKNTVAQEQPSATDTTTPATETSEIIVSEDGQSIQCPAPIVSASNFSSKEWLSTPATRATLAVLLSIDVETQLANYMEQTHGERATTLFQSNDALSHSVHIGYVPELSSIYIIYRSSGLGDDTIVYNPMLNIFVYKPLVTVPKATESQLIEFMKALGITEHYIVSPEELSEVRATISETVSE